jgi:hypothetical protein
MLLDEREESAAEYTDNPSFWIFRGEQKAEWVELTRELTGDWELIKDISKHLHGGYEVVLQPGFGLWLSVHDPNAVYYVASEKLTGCTFSDSAPDWSDMTDPNAIY